MPSVSTQSKANDVDDLKALEHFIVDNDDLLELESVIGRFNIFDALRIGGMEIRHSNFLAYILDPAESHGHEQLFMKALLMDLFKEFPEKRPFSPIRLDGVTLRGVTVKREWKNIDLLITCEEPEFVIAVENKVKANESSNQLNRYKQRVRDEYSCPQMFVYLTPDGREPTDNDWVAYTYEALHKVFTRARSAYRNALGSDVLVFIDHYLSLIETRFMENEAIDSLCQRIYKNHRRALELLFDRVGGPATGVLGAAEEVIEKDGRWRIFVHTNRRIVFAPKSWTDWLPPLGAGPRDPQSWLALRLYLLDDWLELTVQVWSMQDPILREKVIQELITKLPDKNFTKSSGGGKGAHHARVSKAESAAEWELDETPDFDSIRGQLKEKLNEFYERLQDVAETILKPFLARHNVLFSIK